MRFMIRKAKLGLIDISFPYCEGMAIYPDNPQYEIHNTRSINQGDSCTVSTISLGSHTGTHIDAPSHIIIGGKTIDEIPLEAMNGIARVIDMTGKQEIDVEDLIYSDISTEEIILLKTENSRTYNGENVLDDYVTLTYDAAEYLSETGIKMVGIDYMTIELPRRKRERERNIHMILLEKGIVILEALNLKETEADRYRLHCYPLNITGADGSPVRAVLER